MTSRWLSGKRSLPFGLLVPFFLMKIISANRKAPDATPHFATSHLGLFCMHMSHKKNARLIWIIRGVFQEYAEWFHRMFAIAARLMIFHVKHAWYMLIKYR